MGSKGENGLEESEAWLPQIISVASEHRVEKYCSDHRE